MDRPIKVGTRGSGLALRQTGMIIEMLKKAHGGGDYRIVEIVTHGDRFQETPIAEMGGHIERGIFNTGLEEAIQNGEVDFATCSFKDVESDLPAGLCALPVGAREDVRDVLVSRHGLPLSRLPQGAELATSSPRRISQLSSFRSDFRFHPLRGNLTTRVEKAAGEFDGVIVAAAGMVRMGLQEHITQWIDTDVLLPAPAQAAMGCEYLEEREDIARLIAPLRRQATEIGVMAEKRLLTALSGGCFAPIGALATIDGEQMTLQGRAVSLDGKKQAQARSGGAVEQWEELVERTASLLREQGAVEIIQTARQQLQGN